MILVVPDRQLPVAMLAAGISVVKPPKYVRSYRVICLGPADVRLREDITTE